MYDLIIEDATIITGARRQVADICVQDGRIAYVGARPGGSATKKVSAIGKFVIPGLIDTHVHFRSPGHPHKEDWASGSRAAVSGGVTTVCDMPNTDPPTLTRAEWEEKRRLAASEARCNFGIWVGAAAGNIEDVIELTGSGDACGVKVFMGASTGPLLVDDATLVRYFERTTALMGVHAEDEQVLVRNREQFRDEPNPAHEQVRPAEAAAAAVRRLIQLVREYPRPVHICHLSTGAELELLEAIRGDLPITSEVSPHHLFLASDHGLGNFGKCNPPIRPEVDRRALWTALKRGHIDTLGSDHAPHTREEKERPYWEAPAGIPGVETTFPLMQAALRQGRVSLERLVQLCCETPARIFGFSGKGKIAAGFDADLLLFAEGDLVRFTTADVLSRAGWSPFVGQKLGPKPEQVYVAGALVAQRGQIVGDDVRGSLVRRG